MKRLMIQGTDDSPQIVLDKDSGTFEISGRSLPEDSASFFAPVLEWIREYSQSPNDSTIFVFKLEYFNTASSKFIHDIMLSLQSVKNVSICWCHREEDETTEEAGIEFSEQINVPFNFKRYA
ncbi:MAG TPA: DUF1987 domain-containing protein [Chryseosolibacter sp.]|nr:DUF1987 domain-containing protein [Chryseosolibacter sp.]